MNEMMINYDEYESVIGLEVHVELNTKSKIFCGCSASFGGAPNTRTCPVCSGMPGTLPVLNRKVLEYAIRVGLAMHCEISRISYFDRKNYFYPDNPQNYQISQLYMPICTNGYVEIESPKQKKIGIHEIHMEEDAGKLFHDEETGNTLVDFNRAGVPLIEIVSEPDMRSAEEVIAYLDKLRMLVRYLGVSDCKLQEGSMRADVNLSVRKKGAVALGTRTEMKNLNSFSAVKAAVEAETKRQIALLEAGAEVAQETRRWDENKMQSYCMRSKDDAMDYRYFPEPDLLPVEVSDACIEEYKAQMPEFREEKRKRFAREYDIPEYDIKLLTESKKMADLFEDTAAICKKPKEVSNWLMGEGMRLLKEREMSAEELTLSANDLAELIRLVSLGEINRTVAKEVFEAMFLHDAKPAEYIAEKGLKQESDAGVLEAVAAEVLAANEGPVSDYLGGKERALGFLVGQVMKHMGGKANPEMVRKILLQKLSVKK